MFQSRTNLVALGVLAALFGGVVPALADDTIEMSFVFKQVFNNKSYGFCFSDIQYIQYGLAPAGRVEHIQRICSGTFSASATLPNKYPIQLNFFGPISVTCPNGQVANTKLGNNNMLFNLMLNSGATETSTTVTYPSPCGDNTVLPLEVGASYIENHGWFIGFGAK